MDHKTTGITKIKRKRALEKVMQDVMHGVEDFTQSIKVEPPKGEIEIIPVGTKAARSNIIRFNKLN